MIKIMGRLFWNAHRHEWRYGYDTILVTCDHEGCGSTVVPTGVEHNGAAVESVYGCDGWWLGKRTLCPDHPPTREELSEWGWSP